ncbi:MAG: proline dehydrogenase [Acidobacteria bacterium]|nr:proline dehydrogenase [Acidobacteriota bacterium]
MLKNLFLSLSQNGRLRQWMEHSEAARPLSRRFIAGNTLDDGLAVVKDLARRDVLSALDPLGENVTTEADAQVAAKTAMDTLQAVTALGAGATVSIKLTQFGLDLSETLTMENVLPLVREAKRLNARIEVDMESSAYTKRTIEALERMSDEGPVRAVIQAYLYRTEKDIENLNARKIPIRLCKGAYNEPENVAFPRKADVDENYKKMASRLLEHGTYPAFATHDPAMIDHVLSHKPAADHFEFQMLYGIRRDMQERVLAGGWRLRLYVPYGPAWYPYFMRRLAERPANVWFVAKSIFS